MNRSARQTSAKSAASAFRLGLSDPIFGRVAKCTGFLNNSARL